MAAIVITTTVNTLNIDFGQYAGTSIQTGLVPMKRCINKDDFFVSLLPISLSNYVEVVFYQTGFSFPISFDGQAGTFKVDSIDGQAIVSNEDLYSKLSSIKA